MATFKYVGKDAESKSITGKISADDRNAVIEELRKRKLTIISVTEVKDEKVKAGARKKVKPEEVVLFARQLATMVEAGMPILQGLNALSEQTTNEGFKKVLTEVEMDIKHGSSLSSSFAKHPYVFNNLFVNLVKVGETGGILATVLDRVSTYMEKTLSLQRKVKSALVYPAVVVSMAGIITIILLVKVVPTFSGIYSSFGKELPPMTQVLVNTSNFLRSYLLLVVAAIVGLIFAMNRWHKTEKGAVAIDGAILRMPVFGELLRKVAVSRFTRTLATLVQSGVPILESLNIVEKTIGNRVLENVIKDVQTSVRQGESLAVPLEKSSVFPPMVTRMISIGEKSGQMEKMLLKVSEFYDDQVDTAVEGLTSMIEPLIIGVMGIVIGFIVVALFMPILSMSQLVS
ncbi:MAG: type II secretion system F family protein [Candidatus Omnitrophica bacterium]|nr:type II secretion system F family protein [Candidatus Omnitrophota bacterium]